MLIIGLTGGVATGKSTVAQMFADEGAAVFDADAAVHRLYAGAAVAHVATAFPAAIGVGAVDRARLAAIVTRDPAALARLEAIVHPLVRTAQDEFLAAANRSGRRIAVLEIPLLFETGGDRLVDVIVVVSAPLEVQRERVRERGRMTDSELDALTARQTSDTEKRSRAHFVIDTNQPKEATREDVRAVIRALAASAAG
jgi:dephospho-CoA kinase